MQSKKKKKKVHPMKLHGARCWETMKLYSYDEDVKASVWGVMKDSIKYKRMMKRLRVALITL